LALARGGGARVLGELGVLEDAEHEGGDTRSLRVGVLLSARLDTALALRLGALEKLRAVGRYATARGCRRRALLAYFGEDAPRRCGACDRCLREGVFRRAPAGTIPWHGV
jgi:ATP-dependent DNA helicase RecQ